MRFAVYGILCLAGILALAFLTIWTPDKSRETLEARYLRAPSDMMEVLDTRLHVRDDGPRGAPAILMIHGFGSSLHTWEPWAQDLAGAFRPVRLDLPGAGLSPPDPTGRYDDERVIDLILALLDRKGIKRAHLVGNSIGGRIAWIFAARHPERTRRIVLIAPDGFASPGFEYGEAPEVPAVLTLMRYALPKWMLRAQLAESYGNPERLSDETVTRYHDLLLAPGARGANLERLRQTILTDPRPRLRGIEAPVLLVWGEKDALIPARHAEDYLEVLPDARLVTFPELGHVPQEEAPARSLPPVRRFLEGAAS